ncbi:MAG: hypothetical protein WCF78_04905 [archaeon]
MAKSINNSISKDENKTAKQTNIKSKFNSKKYWTLIIIVIVIIIALIIFLYLSSNKNKTNADCGKNINCFIKSANNCNLSKVNYEYILNSPTKASEIDTNITSTLSFTLEIKGYELDKCVVNKILNNTEIIYNDSYIQFLLSQGKSMSDIENDKLIYKRNINPIGIGSTCKVDVDYLIKFLRDLKQNSALSIDSNYCVPTKDGVPINTP